MTKAKVKKLCEKNSIEFFTEDWLFTAWSPDGFSFEGCGVLCVSWHGGESKTAFWQEIAARITAEFTEDPGAKYEHNEEL